MDPRRIVVQGHGALLVECRSLPCPSVFVDEDDLPERFFENGHHVGNLSPVEERPACAPPSVKGATLIEGPVETGARQRRPEQLVVHSCLLYQFTATFANRAEPSVVKSRRTEERLFGSFQRDARLQAVMISVTPGSC